ncbi:MAG: mRNA interferase MazF [Methanofollis sp.]|nr:mRNA interferase MazF [Methanofollis sp.]
MGEYFIGDVVIAPIRFRERESLKNRPAIVVAREDGGLLRVCPVTSKVPFDMPSLPLDLDDFATGGLDLFKESYLLPSSLSTIRNADVVGKKGRVTEGYLNEISRIVHAPSFSGNIVRRR